MARYVIDAQTLIYLIDSDIEIGLAHQLVAPNTIRSEAMQILLTEVRAGRRSEQEAMAHHRRITELKMRTLGDRVSRASAWQLAREQDWDSMRDAEYLTITSLQADALVTVDTRLAKLAEHLVPLASVEALLATP